MANKDYISDELLAAYLEGNTSEEETRWILQALKTDESLNGDLSAFSDYGLAYEDPLGNGWYTFSKSLFNDDLTFENFNVNILL